MGIVEHRVQSSEQAVVGAGRVKVAGSGHSFTDIACTDGVMVDMSSMNRVLAVDGDEVTVEPGITLHDLGEELRSRGLAMENQGDIDAQTLAGATASCPVETPVAAASALDVVAAG